MPIVRFFPPPKKKSQVTVAFKLGILGNRRVVMEVFSYVSTCGKEWNTLRVNSITITAEFLIKWDQSNRNGIILHNLIFMFVLINRT